LATIAFKEITKRYVNAPSPAVDAVTFDVKASLVGDARG
jgi:hypothetical protein